MHFSLPAALAVAPVALGFVLPRGYQSVSYSTSSKISCNTVQGLIKPFWPAPTYTATVSQNLPLPVLLHATSTPTSTVTPLPLTVVSKLTSVLTFTLSLPHVTSVFSTTSTLVESVLKTVTPVLATSSSTRFVTSTTYTATSTIAASGGFRGVLETGLPGLMKDKRDMLLRSDAAADEIEERGLLGDLLGGLFGGGSSSGSSSKNLISVRDVAFGHLNLYPLLVQCTLKVLVTTIIEIIEIASPVTTTLRAQTVTSTTTTTSTSTSTIPPSTVTRTSSFSTTKTVTNTRTLPQETYTKTGTVTSTLSLPTSTYLACAASNLLGPVLPAVFGTAAGEVISDLLYDPHTVNLITTVGKSAYDCCVQCVQQQGCAFGGFTADGRCWLEVTTDQTCPSQASLKAFGEYVSSPPPVDLDWAVYNGQCGLIAYGGEDQN